MEWRRTETHPSLVADPILSADQAAEIAVDAYIYGYPLVLMDVTRQVATAATRAGGHKAAANQFVHRRELLDPSFTEVVSPNADTLYSTAWLDLTKGPIVLSLPEAGSRHYVMPLLDAWTNVFASLGPRTTGSGKGNFAILGPRWRGRLPMCVQPIVAPTFMVWLIGRTQTRDKEDYAAVNALQDQYKLTPMSAWGTSYVPPPFVPVVPDFDSRTPPCVQVARMDAATFFDRLNALMRCNPPAPADAEAMERFEAIGVAPDRPLGFASLDPVIAEALEQSIPVAQALISAAARRPHGRVNGWHMALHGGAYGTDYLGRAAVAHVGLGANLPADALYPRATMDSQGRPLSGLHRYMLHFPPGQRPPVNAFWSLTLYNARQAFVPNPLDRYAIGDRDPLALGDDGSLTLYIQQESPGPHKESNWLPAPPDSFNLVLRLYWPGERILDGSWEMPPLERVY